MRRHSIFVGLLLLIPVYSYSQRARLSGKVNLDTNWVHKFYISRIPRFDDMFTVSRALIIAEGNIDAAGNFAVNFPVAQRESLYRLHFIRKGDPASTLLIGSRDVNHVFFIARQGDQIHFIKKTGQPLSQSAISGSKANAELNALLGLAGNDTTGNNALIGIAGRSTSQLVGLLAISRMGRPDDRQKEKLRDILAHYDPYNIYGAPIFHEYQDGNYWKLYLAGGILLIAAALLYGYRFYKRRAISRIWRELTQREKDIVALISSGKSNKEVALALNVELSTVKTHVNNIYAKLKVTGRKDLDRYKDLMKSR